MKERFYVARVPKGYRLACRDCVASGARSGNPRFYEFTAIHHEPWCDTGFLVQVMRAARTPLRRAA